MTNTYLFHMNHFKNLVNISKLIYHPLTKDHRLLAIANFIRWQIGSKLIKKKIIVPWIDDSKFVVGKGETGLTGNLYTGFMEFEDMVFLLHALQPSHKFVDIGANVGAYTILASKVIKANSIAFEPVPETANRLKDQIYLNRIENSVEVRNIGIGNENSLLYFTNNSDTTNKVNIKGEDVNTIQVEVKTLDSQVSSVDPLFLKIDVEGFEHNVIQGAQTILSSDNLIALIIELNGSGEEFGHTNEEIHQKLISHNLIPITYNPFTKTITQLDNYNKNAGNTIYVKDIEKISKLCKQAPLRTVHTANQIQI